MSSIDERIVQMRFDNKQFESGVKDTMSSLDKLKEKLSFGNVSNGFQTIERAVSHVSFDPITSQLDKISDKFSAFGVLSRRVLENIADNAYRTGKKMAMSLTGIDQFQAGLGKYGQITSATAAIKYSVPDASMDDIKKTLEDLNTYTDETSYNLVDMVSNVGKFTSAGVGLEEAAAAMKGIGNLTAKAGQNASAASRVMYNFAQSLGTGTVKLQDWMSIENANVATKEFKEMILETASELGTLTKVVDKSGKVVYKTGKKHEVTYQNFREFLSEGWFTSDVLTKVLGKYAGTVEGFEEFGHEAFLAAQQARTFEDAINAVKDAASSGWMRSFQIIVGDLDEATKVWTDLANAIIEVVDAGSEWRNDILQGWRDLGGRGSLLNALTTLWNTFNRVRDVFTRGFSDAFGSISSKGLFDATKGIENFTLSVKKWLEGTVDYNGRSVKRISLLRRVVEGIGGSFKIAWEGIQQFGGFIRDILADIFPSTTVDGLLSGIGNLGETIRKFADDLVKNNVIGNFFSKLREDLQPITQRLYPLAEAIWNFASSVLDLGGIGDGVSSIWDTVKTYFSMITGTIGDWMQTAIDWLTNPENIAAVKAWWDDIASSIKDGVAKVKTFLKPVKDFFKNLFSGGENSEDGPSSENNIFAKIGEFFSSIDIGKVLKAAFAILMVSKAYKTFKKVKSGFGILSNISDATGNISDITETIKRKIKGSKHFEKLQVFAQQIKILAMSIGILALSVKLLSGIDVAGLAKGLVTIGILLAGVYLFQDKMNKQRKLLDRKQSMSDPFKGMLKMAVSISMLALSMKLLSGIDIAGIGKGILALGSIMLMLGLFMHYMDKGRTVLKKGQSISDASKGLMKIGIAVGLISLSFKLLSGIDIAGIGKGILALGAIFTELFVFMKLMTKNRAILSKGHTATDPIKGLVKVAIAVGILALSFKSLGSMNIEDIGKGVLALGSIFAIVYLFSKKMSKLGKPLTDPGATFGLIGLAIGAVSNAINQLGTMRWQDLVKGVVAIGVVMAELVAVYSIMSKTTGKIDVKSMAGMVVFAGAIYVLGETLKSVAKLSWGKIARGLVAMAGIMLLLAGFTALMSIIPSNIGSMAGALLGSLAIILIMNSFASALASVQDIDSGKMLAFAGAIAILAGVLTVMVAVLGALPLSAVLKGGVAIVAIAAALGAAIAIVGAFVAGTMDRFSQSINILGATLTLFSSFMEDTNEGDGDKAVRMVETIAKAFKIAASVSVSSMEEFRQATFRLGVTLSNYSRRMAGVDLLAAIKAVALVQSIATIGAIINSIPDVQDLSTTISNIGSAIGLYNDIIKTSVPDGDTGEVKVNTEGLKQIFQDLADDMPEESAITAVSKYANGGGGLTEYALGIEALKGAISGFATTMAEVSPDDIQVGIDALKAFADIQNQLGEGWEVTIGNAITGIVSFKKEEGDLGTFADGIELLGGGLESFGTSLANVKAGDMLNGIFAAKALQAVLKALPTSGPLKDVILGKQSLAGFAADIGVLGVNLKSLGENVGSVEGFSDTIPAVKDLMNGLADAIQKLDAVGGIEQWFTGARNLKSLTQSLGGDNGAGKDISQFATDLENADLTKVSAVIPIIDGLASAIAKLNGVDSYFNWQSVSDLLWGMATYSSEEIKDANTGETMGKNMLDELANYITGHISIIETAVVSVATALQNGSAYGAFESVGRYFSEGIANGITSGMDRVIAAAESVAQNAVDAFKHIWDERSPSHVATALAAYFDKGLSIGFEKNEGLVSTSANKVAVSAVEAVKKPLLSAVREATLPVSFVADSSSKAISAINATQEPFVDKTLADTVANASTNSTKLTTSVLEDNVEATKEVAEKTEESKESAESNSDKATGGLLGALGNTGALIANVAGHMANSVNHVTDLMANSSNPWIQGLGNVISNQVQQHTDILGLGQNVLAYMNGDQEALLDIQDYLGDDFGLDSILGGTESGDGKDNGDGTGSKIGNSNGGKTGNGGSGGGKGGGSTSNSAAQNAQSSHAAKTASLNDVIERIDDVEAAVLEVSYSVGDLANSMGGMTVKLNGKKLVGELAPDIDKELGHRARVRT